MVFLLLFPLFRRMYWQLGISDLKNEAEDEATDSNVDAQLHIN
jgi:hypothetical protein